ncbi:Protein transport protein S9 plasma membrane t-SNARE [Ceratobasidium sp. 414]|nr:Protein transport protein S9 plasma membrane t-SNARE [Ceratobasidium sp. 414]
MPSWFSRSRSHNEVPPVNDPPAPSGGGYSGGGHSGGSNYGGGYGNNNYGSGDNDDDKARRELFAGASNRPADAASLNPPPSYRSNLGTPQQSPHNQPQQPLPRGEPDRYARNAAIGDKYSRGYGNVDNDRAELFAGHQPAQPRRRFDDNDNQPRDMTGEEEEEEVEGIKRDMRQTKQDSVQSTRNALRIAREAEETARNTLSKLGDQSEKIANTERHIDLTKGSTNRAEDRTDELKQLNRSIFRPVIVFNKDSKRAREEQRLADRHEEERLEREKAALDVRDTQERLGRAAAHGSRSGGGDDNYGDGEEGISTGRKLAPEQQRARQTARSRYQFEATASDDELEDELDDNLDEIGDVAKRLKGLATSMGTELGAQNERIDRISSKTDRLDQKIVRATDRLKRIK